MSLQAEYDYLRSGLWARTDPTKCPCKGTGWLYSDLDTEHKCPIHFNGQLSRDEQNELNSGSR